MKKTAILTIAIIILVGAGSIETFAQRNRQKKVEAHHKVYVNDKRLADDLVHLLQNKYRIKIGDGDYWYDKTSGLWGYIDGGTEGVIPAGWSLGGDLASDASDGNTGVFINGRELVSSEVSYLIRLVGNAIPRGRYWLDSKGNAGYEGRRATVNLYKLSQRKKSGNLYRNFYTGTGSGGSGDGFYVIGKDWSY